MFRRLLLTRTVWFSLSLLLSAVLSAAPNNYSETNLSKLFGQQHATISVVRVPHSVVTYFNTRFVGTEFSNFKISSTAEILSGSKDRIVTWNWGLYAGDGPTSLTLPVPPETGRALLQESFNHPQYHDVLNKGVGAVSKFTKDNKLRPETKGFDGLFEVSEAARDMVNAEVLRQAGVWVAEGIAIVDSNFVKKRRDMNIRVGNYLRAFRVQTRISNLKELPIENRKNSIDDAIEKLSHILHLPKPMTYVEYFYFVLDQMAKTAAVYQKLGYTQDSFHYGQFTLLGEVTDLGIGSFKKPTHVGDVNTIYPYFRYERQPILVQNMLFRTHALKAEPAPLPLNKASDTYNTQDSLFGFIRSFAPEAAEEILRRDPETTFWKRYTTHFSAFNVAKFNHNVMENYYDAFNWDPKDALALYSADDQQRILAEYLEMVKQASTGYDRQEANWDFMGITRQQKIKIFIQAAEKILPGMNSPLIELLAEREAHSDLFGKSNVYIDYFDNKKNDKTQDDLTWKSERLKQVMCHRFYLGQ